MAIYNGYILNNLEQLFELNIIFYDSLKKNKHKMKKHRKIKENVFIIKFC